MIFSIKWLNEFVATNNINQTEFLESMDKIGLKIKNFKIQGEKLKNIVVGKVLFIDEHPYEDRLLVCSVHIGKEKPIQIVTNATNLRAGDLVPVALDGATLANNTTINSCKIHDILSAGMFCSIKDLGISKKDFMEFTEDEALVLNNGCKIGQDIKEAIGFNDTIFEVDIPKERPDCNSVIGLAREISANFDKLLRLRTPRIAEKSTSSNDLLSISSEDKELCPYYCACIIKNIKLGESPKIIKDRLMISNIKPVNNIVDIANYVMLEYGQPINIFDYSTISNGNLTMRHSKAGESIKTIDSQNIFLDEDVLVLSDDKNIFSIPGIIRGQAGCITSHTASVVFEASSINQDYIKNISNKLNLTTEHSKRFENGPDSQRCAQALKRVCEIIEKFHIGEAASSIIESNINIVKPTKVRFDSQKINKFLNSSFHEEDMKQILKKIGCTFEDKHILVIPSYRADLNTIYDVAAEIARFYGYDNIKESSISREPFKGFSPKYKALYTIKQLLTSMGLNEITTSPVIGKNDIDKFNYVANDIVYLNKTPGKVLRPNIIPSILNFIDSKSSEQLEIFEIGSKYNYSEEKNITETYELCCALSGDKYDFYDIKGILEELFDNLEISEYSIEENNNNLEFHPGVSASVCIDKTPVGFFGALNPQISDNYQMTDNTYILKLNLDMII